MDKALLLKIVAKLGLGVGGMILSILSSRIDTSAMTKETIAKMVAEEVAKHLHK